MAEQLVRVVSEDEPPSVFDHRTIDDIYDEIRTVYVGDDRPWIVGYSGGKDSTAALQLIWEAVRSLPAEKRKKKIFVIASDTQVETPVIVEYIDTTLARINEAAAAHGLPFHAEKVEPALADSFWVNLLGHGYAAPSSRFRWCTDRLKIKPANKFILDRVAEHGEVVMILGVRRGESTTRDQVLSLHRIPGKLLKRHSSLPNAFVYTPVEEFSVRDIWSFLLEVDSPWGNDNHELLDLYRNANAGECPLVIDETTPSCGNSRFGCWVCTVVVKDQSMESLVRSGQEWLTPLLDFRNMLAKTQDPERKVELREYKRKNGRVSFKQDGSIIPGPYSLETCRAFLKQLLEAEVAAQEMSGDTDFALISESELHEIRRIWRVERQDWQDSVPAIYRQVKGVDLAWLVDDNGSYGVRETAILAEICSEHEVPAELVAKLLDVERSYMGMNRRAGIYSQLEAAFREEWRTPEELLALRAERN